MRNVGKKVRLASDSRSATYVLFFRVNFMEVVWIVVVWFLLRQLVWARNGIGELFIYDFMQSERGLFAVFGATKKWSKKREDFYIAIPCFNVGNGC